MCFWVWRQRVAKQAMQCKSPKPTKTLLTTKYKCTASSAQRSLEFGLFERSEFFAVQSWPCGTEDAERDGSMSSGGFPLIAVPATLTQGLSSSTCSLHIYCDCANSPRAQQAGDLRSRGCRKTLNPCADWTADEQPNVLHADSDLSVRSACSRLRAPQHSNPPSFKS